MDKYDCLKLENQLCFPLYACSKEIIKKYNAILGKYDLTYTQYIAMMAIWEHKQINIKDLGNCLFLDSGTLTPLVKKLESKGYINRTRSKEDERNLVISITKKGEDLKEDLVTIPEQVGKGINLEPDEAKFLYKILYKIIECK